MTDLPSGRLIAAALAETIVHDADGRTLILRRMTALDRLRLFKAVGAELAQNTAYLGMAMLAASVVEIDGVPVPAASNEAHLEALIGRLGDVGIAAAARGLTAAAPVMGSAEQGN